MKLLILGGSFDPPHRGHNALLEAASRAIRPQRILIVPAHHAPLKNSPSAKAADRLAMLRLSLAALPARPRAKAAIEAYEIKSRRRVFTAETLRHLKKRYPRAELHFAVGLDAALTFKRWKDPARLQRLCRWWTARRPGVAGRVPEHFKLLAAPMPDISSTGIRRDLALGRDASSALEPAVLSYIKRRGLYGLGLLSTLKKNLNPSRYLHTLAVAELAGKLARRRHADARKAVLAGLLHDCGRAVPADKMIAYARKHKIPMPLFGKIALHHPILAHAYISAHLARARYGVDDREILSAVRKHTLGAPEMSVLDKILYVADSASADRGYPGAPRLRALALRDLESAFRECVKNKIRHAQESGAWLHPLTLRLRKSFQA